MPRGGKGRPGRGEGGDSSLNVNRLLSGNDRETRDQRKRRTSDDNDNVVRERSVVAARRALLLRSL